jgi:hypothetical protein
MLLTAENGTYPHLRKSGLTAFLYSYICLGHSLLSPFEQMKILYVEELT